MSDLDVTLQQNNIDVEITVPSKTVDLTISGVKGDQGEPADPTLAIQNQTTTQTNANFNIQSASTSAETAVIRAVTGQTSNLQTWRDENNIVRNSIDTVGRFRAVSIANNNTVNNANIDLPNAGTLISVGTTNNVVLRVRGGTAPQTANLQEWQDSAGTALASINSAGTLTAANLSGTNTGDIPPQRLYQTEYDGGAASTNSTLTIGRVYLQLIHIPRAIKVDAIVVNNGTSSNGNHRVGIYGPVDLTTDNATNSALIVESASVAQVNNSQTITFTETTLQAGKYYLALQSSSSTGVYLRRTANVSSLGMTGTYDRTGGYGAFTNPAPSFTANTNPVVGIYLRCSGTP